jgi:hypothetical protein
MTAKSYQNLRTIHFENELLPQWAQLLDLAARLCPLPEEVRHWFAKFTTCAGVEDARTASEYCRQLRTAIEQRREAITAELRRTREDVQPAQILAAWLYALDTMILQAESRQTCSWRVEGVGDVIIDESDGGDISLRRV